MGVALIPRMVSASDRPRDGVQMRVLEEDRPYRHVVAAVRQGAERGPHGGAGADGAGAGGRPDRSAELKELYEKFRWT